MSADLEQRTVPRTDACSAPMLRDSTDGQEPAQTNERVRRPPPRWAEGREGEEASSPSGDRVSES